MHMSRKNKATPMQGGEKYRGGSLFNKSLDFLHIFVYNTECDENLTIFHTNNLIKKYM